MYSSYIYIAPWKLKKAVGEHGNSGFFWALFLLLRSRPLLFFMECIQKPFIFFLPAWIMMGSSQLGQSTTCKTSHWLITAKGIKNQINILLTIDLCCWDLCPGLKHEPLIFF